MTSGFGPVSVTPSVLLRDGIGVAHARQVRSLAAMR